MKLNKTTKSIIWTAAMFIVGLALTTKVALAGDWVTMWLLVGFTSVVLNQPPHA
jgi:hypothetical protein